MMLFARELRVTSGSKLSAIVLGAVLLVIVGAFLAFGFVLLLGLAAAGLLVGIGAALFRRLTGRPQRQPPLAARHGLDPALEVAPPRETNARTNHGSKPGVE